MPLTSEDIREVVKAMADYDNLRTKNNPARIS